MHTGCDTCGAAAPEPKYDHTDRQAATLTVALAGNPNVGKTSVFNALTGLRQHTGNWPGKTVMRAQGTYTHGSATYVVVDLPGTYSLSPRSADEEVARDFICFGQPDVTVVVTDATALERNLNLVLQVTEITDRIVICLNLIDEARRKGLSVSTERLSEELGVPVIGTVARSRRGIEELKDTIADVASGRLKPRPHLVEYDHDIERAIEQILPEVKRLVGDRLSPRWVAMRVIEHDTETLQKISDFVGTSVTTDTRPAQATR